MLLWLVPLKKSSFDSAPWETSVCCIRSAQALAEAIPHLLGSVSEDIFGATRLPHHIDMLRETGDASKESCRGPMAPGEIAGRRYIFMEHK